MLLFSASVSGAFDEPGTYELFAGSCVSRDTLFLRIRRRVVGAWFRSVLKRFGAALVLV